MKKILIIEDDHILAQMYQTKFEHAGFEIDLAEDGEQGLEKIRTYKPDLVLLDIRIPKINGKVVFEKVRLDSDMQKIPVAIITNIDNPKDKVDFIKKGAAGFFLKTKMTPAQIIEEVKTILFHG